MIQAVHGNHFAQAAQIPPERAHTPRQQARCPLLALLKLFLADRAQEELEATR